MALVRARRRLGQRGARRVCVATCSMATDQACQSLGGVSWIRPFPPPFLDAETPAGVARERRRRPSVALINPMPGSPASELALERAESGGGLRRVSIRSRPASTSPGARPRPPKRNSSTPSQQWTSSARFRPEASAFPPLTKRTRRGAPPPAAARSSHPKHARGRSTQEEGARARRRKRSGLGLPHRAGRPARRRPRARPKVRDDRVAGELPPARSTRADWEQATTSNPTSRHHPSTQRTP